jgi:threonine dehydrogenase-like Zn-dependent dehydrogenase
MLFSRNRSAIQKLANTGVGTSRYLSNIRNDMKAKNICILGGGPAGLAVMEELKGRGFENLTLIDKENFTSSVEQKLLATCGFDSQAKEINLRKIANGKFNFVFGRVREIKYEHAGLRKHEIILTDGQRFQYDNIIMCTGMVNDNKKIENFDKLRKRRDKPVFSGNSMESALFAGRHLGGASGNVLFTSEGNKSRDFHMNYSVIFLSFFVEFCIKIFYQYAQFKDIIYFPNKFYFSCPETLGQNSPITKTSFLKIYRLR